MGDAREPQFAARSSQRRMWSARLLEAAGLMSGATRSDRHAPHRRRGDRRWPQRTQTPGGVRSHTKPAAATSLPILDFPTREPLGQGQARASNFGVEPRRRADTGCGGKAVGNRSAEGVESPARAAGALFNRTLDALPTPAGSGAHPNHPPEAAGTSAGAACLGGGVIRHWAFSTRPCITFPASP